MAPDWDKDNPQLRANLAEILEEIAATANQRIKPKVETTRHWQAIAMRNLEVREARFVSAFRGEPGLEKVKVRVGANYGVDPGDVAEALNQFEAKLQMLVAELDAVLPSGLKPNADQLAAIIDLCAWAHSEWVRIHPFANGNGRTARLWAKQSGHALRLATVYPIASEAQRKLRTGWRKGDAG